MTPAEKIVASRLLDMAARRFHEDSCTETPSELFEDVEDGATVELVDGFNEWMAFVSCDEPHEYTFDEITIDKWMEYMAAEVGEREPEDGEREILSIAFVTGYRMIQGAFSHVSHGGPTREDAESYLKRNAELFESEAKS